MCMTHENIEGALQGNDTRLNVHSKRKRARWRMIASRDDTPVWPRGATLNATLHPPPRNSTTTHTRTQPPSPQCTAATGVYRIFVCSNRLITNTHIFKSQFTRTFGQGHLPKSNQFVFVQTRPWLVHIVRVRFFRGRSAQVNFSHVGHLTINADHWKPLRSLMGFAEWPSDDPKMSRHQQRTLNDLSSNNVMLPTNTEQRQITTGPKMSCYQRTLPNGFSNV